ncbi:hypothetical protein INT43_002480, partial [Umbelopsis isabellina]
GESACKSGHWDFASMKELGDDWVQTDGPLDFSSEGLVMRLEPPTNFEQYDDDRGETLNAHLGTGFGMNATFYMQYGRVTARMRASTVKGIITNFVNMGDNGDEIDTEFVGGHPERFESNYFWGQQLIYTVNGGKHAITSPNGIADMHEYTINWTPERLEWYLDGTLVRTRLQSDTCGDNGCVYPTAPTVIQVGIWDGSRETPAWSTGPVDWSNMSEEERNGIYGVLESITVECDATNNV